MSLNVNLYRYGHYPPSPLFRSIQRLDLAISKAFCSISSIECLSQLRQSSHQLSQLLLDAESLEYAWFKMKCNDGYFVSVYCK